MQEEVKKAANSSLIWLDFFDALLSPSGGFNTEYELDGTHMSPKYLEKMSSALDKVA